MDGAFYEELGGGRFRATQHTNGPWEPGSQHMGPPAALLARALERCDPRPGTALARLCFEVLGPVPVGELAVEAQVERPGRAVELLSAQLSADGRPVVRVRAWRLTRSDTAAVAAGAAQPPAPPHGAPAMQIPGSWVRGYLDAVEWRALEGAMDGSGHAVVWGRVLVDVVAGEAATPLQLLCALADSANGISARLDSTGWLFVNTDLTLHLHREPAGEWFALDAHSVVGPDGVGMTDTTLHDASGAVGHSSQCLLVRHRR